MADLEMEEISFPGEEDAANEQQPIKGAGGKKKKAPAADEDEDSDVGGHPIARMFHIGFKAAALAVYLLGSMLFSDHFVLCVVTDILLLSVDFWTVKNVTGRLLVGLRWWNRVRDDGSSEWVFESHEEERKINARDARVFWLGLYLNMAAWCLLAVTAVLSARMGWMTIIVVSLALNGSNFYGYWKCKKDAKQKLRNLLAQGLATGLTAL